MTQIHAVLALLFPLGIYSLILAEVNRRPRPVVLTGVWDTVGLLFASSGFFLGTAPLLVDLVLFRNWFIWIAYYVLLLVGAVFLLYWRSGKTMIYNVDPDRIHAQLENVLATLGFSSAERGRLLVIVPAEESTAGEETAIVEVLPMHPAPPSPPRREARVAELELESFPLLCHVTLHWRECDPELRQRLEAELAKGLVGAVPDDNPVAGWLLTISGLIFGILTVAASALCLLKLFPPR